MSPSPQVTLVIVPLLTNSSCCAQGRRAEVGGVGVDRGGKDLWRAEGAARALARRGPPESAGYAMFGQLAGWGWSVRIAVFCVPGGNR